jgi:hypothetical protein
MAGIFEAPRNADTLCELQAPKKVLFETVLLTTIAQSWEDRK